VIALGLGVLKLAPAAFWAMTPRELEALFGVRRRAGGEPPRPADLDRLMALYPDR